MLAKKMVYLILFSMVMFSVPASAETEAQTTTAKGLFIELTSDSMFKVRRAFQVGTMVRKHHDIPVLINISLGASRFADKTLPLAAEAIKVRGSTVHEMMSNFIAAGGEVYICPMCMMGNGVANEDLLDGIKVGGPDVVLPRLLEDGVKTLSY